MRRTLKLAFTLALVSLLFMSSAMESNNALRTSQSADPWEMRALLLEANSEMAVAELNGLIYVLGR